MTLTEFLLARIAEDEARVDGIHQGSDPDFFWGPDRIRAECEARRRIVEFHHNPEGADYCMVCVEHDYEDTPWPCPTLRTLALPYADHPDYREEWAQ